MDSWNRYLRGAAWLTASQVDRAAVDLRSTVEFGRQEVDREPARPRYPLNLAVYLAALGEWTEATQLVRDTMTGAPPPNPIAEVVEQLRNLGRLPDIDQERLTALRELVLQEPF